MATTPALAKIAAPQLGNVFLRKRLFKQLDQARQRPVTWISAPAGFGKTSLIASYLNETKLPCLWYLLDSGDGDIASFFYYMGQAGKKVAPRRRKPLPLLTPEYLPELPTFTRNYFRDIFERISSPGVMVLDNYQNIPESPMHQVIADALLEIPEGISVFIISRTEPPAQFTRLQANQTMSFINASDLSFNFDETKSLVQLFGYKDFDTENIQALNKRFNGWCAGLVLQLQQGINDIDFEKAQPTSSQVFDYLAVEIFNTMSEQEQEVLLKSALLPYMSNKMLLAITGTRNSGKILARLNQQSYFTTLHAQSPPVYQYHDLFREFLLKKGEQVFSKTQHQNLQKLAAELLLAENKFEEASILLDAAGDYEAIVNLILKYAPQLAEQGRLQQLQTLINKLPKESLNNPWLRYWRATAMLPFDQKKCQSLYERALRDFEQIDDRAGMFLSWAGIIDSIVFTWGDLKLLSDWIVWMDAQLAKDPVFPNSMVEARVVFGMFCSLMCHQPQHPDMPVWVQRVDTLLENIPDANKRISIATQYIIYLCWIGEFEKAAMVLERLRPYITPDKVQPINQIAWQQAEAMHHWLVADFETSDTFIQNALEIGERNGIHLLDYMLLMLRTYAQFNIATPQERENHLQNLRAIMDTRDHSAQSNYYYMAALDAALQRDPQRALLHLEKAVELIADIGMPFPYALYTIAIARILIELERYDEASDWLIQSKEIALKMKSKILEFSIYLAEAESAFAQNDETTGIEVLTKALQLGNAKHYRHIDWWRPYAMLELCLKALQHDIEVDYVQELIRCRHLLPDNPPVQMENWPWKIKIYTLGRFSVVLDEKPILLDTKGKKKPLELLKVLIAFGGRDVSETKITEALWPDAEGDVAHSAFTTTLSRLRKLLSSDALLMFDGQLSLNDRLCWLDSWAYERILTNLEQQLTGNKKNDLEKIEQDLQKVLTLYKGAFLAKQTQMSWMLSQRERLRLKLLRALKSLIRFYSQQGQCQQVIALYEKAIELDQLAEEYHRGLMKCHAGQGDLAKALDVYSNCYNLFKSLFNIEPSQKTQQLYHTIKNYEPSQLEHLCDACQRSFPNKA